MKKIEELRSKIRQLGHLLAQEQEADTHLGKHREREQLHEDLLDQLYRLEKRTG